MVTREDLEVWVEANLSTNEIAAMFNVKPVTMRRWLRETGLSRSRGQRSVKPDLETMTRHVVEEGLSPRQIAEEYGVKPVTARGWAASYGLNKPGGQPRLEMCRKGLHVMAIDAQICADGRRICLPCKQEYQRNWLQNKKRALHSGNASVD